MIGPEEINYVDWVELEDKIPNPRLKKACNLGRRIHQGLDLVKHSLKYGGPDGSTETKLVSISGFFERVIRILASFDTTDKKRISKGLSDEKKRMDEVWDDIHKSMSRENVMSFLKEAWSFLGTVYDLLANYSDMIRRAGKVKFTGSAARVLGIRVGKGKGGKPKSEEGEGEEE